MSPRQEELQSRCHPTTSESESRTPLTAQALVPVADLNYTSGNVSPTDFAHKGAAMPKAFCPACLTVSRVHKEQYGRKVICPTCGNKFVATGSIRWRPSRTAIAVVILGVIAVVLYWSIKERGRQERQRAGHSASTGRIHQVMAA
jgi:hypothetical protein